jgi:hypothetical protein
MNQPSSRLSTASTSRYRNRRMRHYFAVESTPKTRLSLLLGTANGRGRACRRRRPRRVTSRTHSPSPVTSASPKKRRCQRHCECLQEERHRSFQNRRATAFKSPFPGASDGPLTQGPAGQSSRRRLGGMKHKPLPQGRRSGRPTISVAW